MQLKGFIFSELDYEVVVGNDSANASAGFSVNQLERLAGAHKVTTILIKGVQNRILEKKQELTL